MTELALEDLPNENNALLAGGIGAVNPWALTSSGLTTVLEPVVGVKGKVEC